MQLLRASCLGLAPALVVVALAACAAPGAHDVSSAGSIQAAPFAAGAARTIAANVTGQLYVGESQAALVSDYALPDGTNQPPMCTTTSPGIGGSDIGVDAHHVLYVPEAGTHRIPTFGPNCQTGGRTLNNPGSYPSDIAFDGASTVYVTDASSDAIAVYDRGATFPTRVLANPAIAGGSFGVAVDSSGNVFAAAGSSPTVVEYPHGRQMGSRALQLSGLRYPSGLAFDRDGNLLVVDNGVGAIRVYAPPFAGAAKRSIAMKGSSFYGKLDAANRNLYVADSSNGSVDIFSYPSGQFRFSITKGLAYVNGVLGLAIDPPSNP